MKPTLEPTLEPTLDLALIRWSVACRTWQESSAGSQPHLGAFLAGWFLRVTHSSLPTTEGIFRDSLRVGWHEAGLFDFK